MRTDISERYFQWLCDITELAGYSKLLALLHDTRFAYRVPMDKNRESDGLCLRWRFMYETNIGCYSDNIGPKFDGCSVLEMMTALALRMGEEIMCERAGKWFLAMLKSLGLSYMTDDCFNQIAAVDILDKFLKRKFRRNGCGGLFTVTKVKTDMRATEIWYQMCLYLDEQF